MALLPGHIRAYILELPERDEPYTRKEIVAWVVERHRALGGLESKSNPTSQTKKALQSLVDGNLLERVASGHYRRTEAADTLKTDDEFLAAQGLTPSPSLQSRESAEPVPEAAPAAVEVEIGTGREAVYGWYYPAYRELATLKGEKVWPIKVGRTGVDPETRMVSSSGFSPEQPVLGFVHHAEDAESCEKYHHAILSALRKHIGDARGTEWFNTSLDKLRGRAEEYEAMLSENGDEE